MKKLKKLALWLMMLVLVFSLAACGEKEDDDSKRDRDRVEERDDEDEDDDKSKDEDEEDDDKSKDDEDDKSKDDDEKLKPEATEEPVATEAPQEELISAKELILEITEASQNRPMTSCSYEIGMDFGINMEGFSMDMNISSKGDMLMSMDPYVSYTEMVMQMKMLGQENVELTKAYMLEENGEVVTYTSMGENGEWMREASSMSVDDMLQQNTMSYDWLTNKPAEEFVIDTELHTINGKETYKVSLTLTGEEMQAMMDNMGGMEGLMEDTGVQGIDYTLIDVPATYYVDTTTHQVVQMDMNIEGMGEMMTKVLEESLAQDPSMAGYTMEVTIGEFIMSYTNISYDTVEVPEIPVEIIAMQGDAGAADEPIDSDDPINFEDPSMTGKEPGTDDYTTDYPITKAGDVYNIEESGSSVDIVCPEGWQVTYTAYDTLSVEHPDSWQMVEFMMYVGMTSEDFKEHVETTEVDSAKSMDMYISHEEGPTIGSFTTMQLLCDGINLYYAWAPVGEGMVYVTVVDFDGLSLEEALAPAIEWVQLDKTL